jgi:hypothetical protein
MWIKDENGNWRRVHHTLTQDALDTIAQELERRYAAGEPRLDIEEYRHRRRAELKEGTHEQQADPKGKDQ